MTNITDRHHTSREWLEKIGFTANSENTIYIKSMLKEVETALHGTQYTTLVVDILLEPNGALNVRFDKDGKTFKKKIYSFGFDKAYRAIAQTVANAGFNLREEVSA